MFVDNKVVKKLGQEERYDKFVLAAALHAVSFEGASCSLIEAQVLSSCEDCNLKFICRKLDEVIEEYTEKTTVVAASFKF